MMSPEEFEFAIEPRSSQHAELIRSYFLNAITSFAPYEECLSAEEKEWLAKSRVVEDSN
jgi:hypothetical protein